MENIFYNPTTTNKFKIAISNLLAFILAIFFIIIMTKLLILVNANILKAIIICSVIMISYVGITNKIFKFIFK